MPQTDAERLLGPSPMERVTPQDTAAPRQGPSDAERLLTPGNLFGPSANPMMERTAEGERPPNVEFDFPEITQAGEAFEPLPGTTMAQTLRLAGGLLFAMDEAQQIDIIRDNIPGADLQRDKFGNLFVRIPRQGPRQGPQRFDNYYINRPGLSPQDLTQLGAVGATALPAGRAGAAAGAALSRGAPVLGRIAGAGAAEGALSAGIDLGLQTVGSGQPANLGRAGTAALAGTAGEALVTMLTRRMGQINTPRRPVVNQGGQLQLSPEARRVVEEAGLDPNALTQDFIARLDTELGRAAKPAEAVRTAEAGSLPVEVPLTRGNVTRANSDQLFEDAASKGAFGRSVESIVEGIRAEQQTALRGNVEAIQDQIGGGTRQVVERGQGGVIGQQALEELRRNANDVVGAAYDLAETSGQAGLAGRTMPSLVFNLEAAAGRRLRFSPKAQDMVAELRELGDGVGPDGAVLVEALFDWRRDLTRLASEAADATEAGALADIRRAFDSQMVDIVERGLLEGNDEAVDLWLNAIRARREFGNIWEAVDKDAPNYLVDRLTQTLRDGDQAILRVAPEAAANFIFGASRTGLTNNPALARQLLRLKGVLVEGGRRDAWDALREEAVVRLFNAAEGTFDANTTRRVFSGAKFSTAIDNAMRMNAPVMRTLFNAEELRLLDQLKRVAVSIEARPGGANRSNTSAAASQMFQSVFGKVFGKVFGPVARAAAASDSFAGEVFNLPMLIRAMRSRNAQAGGVPAIAQPGVGAAIGATGTAPADGPRQR